MASIGKLNYTADEINEKLEKVNDPVQTTGDSETLVMSQKAVTDTIKALGFKDEDFANGTVAGVELYWDTIIRDSNNFLLDLSHAVGNVLIDFELPYEGDVIITLSDKVKLIDFNHCTFKIVRITADANANTIIRNLNTIPPVDMTSGEENGYLKNFGAVENCRGILRYENCSSIENCDVKEAVSCSHIRDCAVVYSESSATAIFDDCNFINNVDVSGYVSINGSELHFRHCHHITNIHDYNEQGDSPYISYSECNFVDPYTCAGYVSPDNSGKVPVPDNKGGVEFKEFVPSPTPHKTYFSFIGIGNDGLCYPKQSSQTTAGGGFVPLRTAGGQIVAPNQLEKQPALDEYISRRYLEANGVGSKLYRHDICFSVYNAGSYAIYARFTLYNRSEQAYTSYKDFKGTWYCIGAYTNETNITYAQIEAIYFASDRVFVSGYYVNGSGEAYSQWIQENGAFWENYEFTDTVTEV